MNREPFLIRHAENVVMGVFICIALIVFAALGAFGCTSETPNNAGRDVQAFEKLYQDAITNYETVGPWLSVSPDDPAGKKIPHPTIHAMILSAESLRFSATHSADAKERIDFAIQFLLDHADEDKNGTPSWGLPYAWPAFGLEPLPAETPYSIVTSYIMQSFFEAIKSGALSREQTEQLRGVLIETSLAWEKYFIWTANDSGFFLYSTATSQPWFVPNVSSMLCGSVAQTLGTFPDSFSWQDREDLTRIISACAKELLQSRRAETFSWPYSDFEDEIIDFNDLGHHVAIIHGLELMRKYAGIELPYTINEALDSMETFFDGGFFEYPAELREISPDADPFTRPARTGSIVYAAELFARLGDFKRAVELLDKFQVQSVTIAPILYGGDL